MDKLGKMVKARRQELGLTVQEASKKLACSVAFVRHIEGSKTVPVSPRLITAIRRTYRIRLGDLELAAAARNKVAKSWYKSYRRKAAKKVKGPTHIKYGKKRKAS